MTRKETEELILREVVLHYLNSAEPIGSVQLQSSLNFEISSATIRNYFRRLVEAGFLAQLHTSSGRVPTSQALRHYWEKVLPSNEVLRLSNLQKIEESARANGIFALLRSEKPDRLTQLLNVEDNFLIARFEQGSVLLEYSRLLERFLKEFIGYFASDLYRIARENRIEALEAAMQKKLQGNKIQSFNHTALLRIAAKDEVWADAFFESCLNGTFLDELPCGVHFKQGVPPGHLVYTARAVLNDQPVSLLAMGHMSRDFRQFLGSL